MKYSLFLIFVVSVAFGQYLREIEVLGNAHTKKHIIIRELEHPIPGNYNPILAEEDRNRLYNLGIFSQVTISPADEIYRIELIETPHIIPLPLLYYDENKGKKGWTYGAGVIDINFRGLNEKTLAGFTIGNLDNYFLSYENPKVGIKQRSIEFEIQKLTQEDGVYAVTEKFANLKTGTGFQVDNRHYYQLLLEYSKYKYETTIDSTRWEYPDDIPFANQFVTSHFSYIYDSRDIRNDPSKGSLSLIKFEAHKELGGKNDVLSIQVSNQKSWLVTKKYKQPVFHMKHKLIWHFADELPLHLKRYLGGGNHVRGYSSIPQNNPSEISSSMEVDNLALQSLELQFTLLPKIIMSDMEFGVDQSVFLDWGYGWRNRHFKAGKGIVGIGYGLRFFVSGFGVIAVDLGFNPYGSPGIMNIRDSD